MSLITHGQRSNIFDPFSLDIWDPFQLGAGGFFPLDAARSLTPDAGTGGGDQTSAAVVANTRIDWKETPDAHVFRADLPGVRKEEVKVEVEEEGRVLQISGERSKEQVDREEDKWHRVERTTGRFLRRFRLPENAKMDEVKATMDNGVLTVLVPKEELKRPEVKRIEISGGDGAAGQQETITQTPEGIESS